ncbi:MAG: hypothetical protein JXR30_02805 [Alphaproteobacteria bacterium]|nr:hypothetical protein [Alphaproteobacteria bacterium]
MEQNVNDHMRMLLRDMENLPEESKKDLESYPELLIPNHMREFVLKNRLPLYVENIINAKYYYTKGKDYIIRDGKIMIVDVDNTGVVHENMTWCDGLHQALQLKHGAAITSEQMSTNFLANTTFFLRYGKNIYGLSGTLGCNVSKNFLKQTYNVDLVVIPPFKVKQHTNLTPQLYNNKNQWRRGVVDSLMSKVNTGRACLVIAESINDADEFEKILSENDYKYPKSKILMYRTEKESKVIGKSIKKGEIILSTNISGRGTDIILEDKVNENGGLHVCITFLPENTRVERQNLGKIIEDCLKMFIPVSLGLSTNEVMMVLGF